MLSFNHLDQLDRLTVVLVRARNPNNIGAVARAMHDFGFRHLRIVNEYAVPFQTARSAVDASSVIEAAEEYGTLAEAVADCTLVVGTTAVGNRSLDHPVRDLRRAAPLLQSELTGTRRVALLFGSEKTGLSNEELSHCHWLLTIPMRTTASERHISMNLGQAVAVCLYEIIRESGSLQAPATIAPMADDLERLTSLLTEVLEQSGYTQRHPANCDPAQLRRLVRRIVTHAEDAPVWMGILRQLLWSLSRS